MKSLGRYALAFAMVGIQFAASAQQDSLKSLTGKFEEYSRQTLQEKLFVHTDRSFYLTGETVWFKIYDVDASSLMPLTASKVVYLELLDRENRSMAQTKVELTDGSGGGTLFLSTALVSGNYILRAYTQWMKNFSPDLYFHEPLTVVNPFSSAGLKPKDIKPRYDAQFFPEGGHLVRGLPGRIGFRVVDPSGKGIDFRGAVLNGRNDTVARFSPLKFGMGNFDFTPQQSQTYRTSIRDSRGHTYSFPFPNVEAEGFVMAVRDSGINKVHISVGSHFNGTGRKPYVYLLGHAGKRISISELNFLENGAAHFLVDKKKLGEGINHFTVFTSELVPVCERLYFKQPEPRASLDLKVDHGQYGQRKRVTVALSSGNRTGQPTPMNLSVAVYRMDSLEAGSSSDIVSSLWLTSELKGTVESPGYYFSPDRNPLAIDNLMLTHGWSRFQWDEVLKSNAPVRNFLPEFNGHLIQGRLLNAVSGKPEKGIVAYLASPGKLIRLYPSRSDDQGRVWFEMQNFVGSRRVIAQTNYLTDSLYRVELINPFSEVISRTQAGEFDLEESQGDALTARSLQMQIQNAFYEENPNRIVQTTVDSSAFYGKPDELYFLDAYTRFPTMEEVMREYVPGVMVRRRQGQFHFLTQDHPNKSLFRSDPMVLLDGVPVFSVDKIMQFDPRKIKRLDVVTQQYMLGPVSFDGLVSYATYKGDLSDYQADPRALVARYEGLQWKREFFLPQYESESGQKKRVPDLRSLLFWSAEVKTDNTGKTQFSFSTSDVAGSYKMVVQGITPHGEPATQTAVIAVTGENEF